MTPCERKCWDCGNVAMHDDNVSPHVLCKKCGSQDTRLTDKTTFFLTQMADLLRENTKGIEDSINELGEIRATLLTRTEKLKRDISVIFGRARLGALDEAAEQQ